MKLSNETRAYNAIQTMLAKGWHDEAQLVDHAANIIAESAGGMDKARRIAQAVWNGRFKITTPN
jgi:hypothetical protein